VAAVTVPAYPLSWPDGLPRTERKANSQFRTSLSAALKNVRSSLEAFGRDSGKAVSEISISSNVTLGQDRPADTGVAVWFTWDGQQRCIAVDRYPKPEDNLQAIHHVLEARRTEMRHGGLHVVRQTFKGFTALPAPAGKRDWREVLGFRRDGRLTEQLTAAAIDQRYRELAAKAHPDKGGTTEQMAELNRARAEAKAAIA
jgi:hypothetical protein